LRIKRQITQPVPKRRTQTHSFINHNIHTLSYKRLFCLQRRRLNSVPASRGGGGLAPRGLLAPCRSLRRSLAPLPPCTHTQ
jgi:hypothetical protein